MKPKFICQHKGCMRFWKAELWGRKLCEKHQRELMQMREIKRALEGKK